VITTITQAPHTTTPADFVSIDETRLVEEIISGQAFPASIAVMPAWTTATTLHYQTEDQAVGTSHK